MTLWVLDTDCLSLLQRGHLLLVQRMSKIAPQDIAVTIVTAEEQFRGRLDAIRQNDSPEGLVSRYARLQETLEDFKSLNILKFNQIAYNRYADLRRQKIRIGTQDLRIAAIVLSVDGILVTRNQRDFARIPGLKFEDWSIP